MSSSSTSPPPDDLAKEVAELRQRLTSLEVAYTTLERARCELERVQMLHEEDLDTFARTPAWKKLIFWLDGWSLHKIMDKPHWRPWHKKWTS